MEGRQHPVGMLEEETHGLSIPDLHVSSRKRGSHQSSVDEKAPSAHLLCREADPLDAQVPAEAGIKDAR